MERLILSEQGYREQMENVVEPYLDIRKSVLWPEREEGKKIYCERYLADSPKGVVMISHGFTETAEKYTGVGGILRFFQLRQGQIRGND